MFPEIADLDLLEIQVASRFLLNDAGRIRCENSPDRSTAPRLYLAGCGSGNLARLRQDVGDETACAIERLVAGEPPLGKPESTPIHLDDYLRLMATEATVARWSAGLIWTFPPGFTAVSQGTLVRSDTPEGDRLLARLAERGMPEGLATLGFKGVGDFWAPWCVALRDEEIVSVALTARLGQNGAEPGVATVAAWRGQGYATAATAGWAAHPSLRGRPLFYSTWRTNLSSRRVAERLGLRFLGASLAIT